MSKLKKYLFIILLVLAFSNSAFAVDVNGTDFAVTPADLNGEVFFRSPMSNKMIDPEEDMKIYDYDFDTESPAGMGMKKLKDGEMPLFKQVRLYLTKKVHKIIPSDSVQPESLEEEIDADGQKVPEVSQNQQKSFKEKLKFWKKKNAQKPETGEQLISEEGSIVDSIQNETFSLLPSEETLSLETGISEQVTEKELTLDAENVNFDEETSDMIATGRPVLNVPPQKATVIADTMIYNQDSNIIKGIGNVVVIKDGLPSTADYAEVDMNEETMFADNLASHTNLVILNAEKAIQQNDKLILTNGDLHSDVSNIYRMSSRMIGPRFDRMIVSEDEQALFFGDPTGNKISLDIDSIYVDAGKNHDKFTAKHIKVNRKGKRYFTWPSLTVYADKDREYFEANYPEFGTRHKLGLFVGPGFVFGGPVGSIIKVIPFLNYDNSKFGFGGALKYHNKFNYTELGYGTSNEIFFLRGEQRLDDDLYLRYGSNTFMEEWFLGSRMAKYTAELIYDKGYSRPNFLAEGRHLVFQHRASVGLMQDNDRNYYGERFNSNGIATTRFRYMAGINQKLYGIEKPEDRFYFDLSFLMQGSAAVYGTGDTQFIGRVGPMAHVQYKNWMQDVAYYQTAYDDKTPLPRYDAYRYGHSSLYVSEIFRLNKYLSVGWSGMVNLSNDAPNGKLFQENRFVVAVGPEDLKLRVGYDFVRQSTYMGFDVAFDTKGTKVKYKRMEIKNPERLGKTDKNTRKLAFSPASLKPDEEVKSAFKFGASKAKQPPKVLNHAQVIEIEDPDKETVD